jgi:hypothetical protein
VGVQSIKVGSSKDTKPEPEGQGASIRKGDLYNRLVTGRKYEKLEK